MLRSAAYHQQDPTKSGYLLFYFLCVLPFQNFCLYTKRQISSLVSSLALLSVAFIRMRIQRGLFPSCDKLHAKRELRFWQSRCQGSTRRLEASVLLLTLRSRQPGPGLGGEKDFPSLQFTRTALATPSERGIQVVIVIRNVVVLIITIISLFISIAG